MTDWNLETGEGVKWTADLPGLGNSSPVVWGNSVIVTTAVAEGLKQEIKTGLTGAGDGIPEEVPHSWRVMAFEQTNTGEKLWDTEIANAIPDNLVAISRQPRPTQRLPRTANTWLSSSPPPAWPVSTWMATSTRERRSPGPQGYLD